MKLRAFQQRIIDNSDLFLKDDHMHIVAPPGSGKTIIGVEMIKKVNQPTLILVPTLILKNQWLTVLKDYFSPDQLSDSLESNSFIIVTTYQDFYSKRETFLKQLSFEFIILDEAHHLKKAWANELLKLKNQQNLQFLSLTATPPYDAPPREWQTYLELNGKIDEEVATAELIKEGILTSYQDYLYLMPASKTSQTQLKNYLKKHEAIEKKLLESQEIAYALIKSDFIISPLENSNFIFDHITLYLSSLAYLANQGYQLNKEHWEIIGLEKRKQRIELPPPSHHDLETILTYLYDIKPDMNIFSYLKKNNWFNENELALFPYYQPTNQREYAPLKKEAIEHIILKEELFLKEKLCAVVFLDFIKEDGLVNSDVFLDLGVVPVFIQLEKLIQIETEIAAICGSFLLVSNRLLEETPQLAPFQKMSQSVSTAPNHKKIVLTDQNRLELTKLITHLLNEKKINILVGTISFLGEGWNCPGINTIVLGNSASSFVQTQQLRGRGLRVAQEKELTNIWHIAPIYPSFPLSKQPELLPIVKRLSFIEGLDFLDSLAITSNLERFDIPKTFEVQQMNARISDNFEKAKNRSYYATKWQEALYQGHQLAMPVVLKNDVRTTSNEQIQLNTFLEESQTENFFTRFNWWFFPKIRAKRQWRKYCKTLANVLTALVNLLIEENILLPQEKLKINQTEEDFSCSIETERYYAKRHFNDLAVEILSTINNPRYIVKINNYYFTVPQRYAVNREQADLFFQHLLLIFPKASLFYTKNKDGRKELMNAYFSQYPKNVLQHKIWQ